jgi:hypothetical protein
MSSDFKKEDIEILKERYLDFIKEVIQEEASLPPSFTAFCQVKDEVDPDSGEPMLGLVHIPVPGKFMKDEDAKDELVNEVIPKIFEELKKKFVPHALAWASEVWMTSIKKTEDVQTVEEAYEKALETPHVNRQEAVFISIDSEEGNEVFVYNIHREGKQINSDGDLVDKVRLERNNQMNESKTNKVSNISGRFANLFHKLK